MVPIKDRESLHKEIGKEPTILGFSHFLLGIRVESRLDEKKLKNAEEIPLICLSAIQENDKVKFEKCLNAISRRKPNKASPWIYNDFLIFSLILGAKFFHVDFTVLTSLLALRHSEGDEKKRLTDSFSSLAEGNFEFSGKFGFVSFFVSDFLGKRDLANSQLQEIFSTITSPPFWDELSIFSKLLALKIYDRIIELKELDDPSFTSEKNQFIATFRKRVEIIGNLFFFTLLLCFIGFTVFLIYVRFNEWTTWKEFVETVKDIYTFIGLGGILGLLTLRKYVVKLFDKLFFFIFGYNESILNKKP